MNKKYNSVLFLILGFAVVGTSILLLNNHYNSGDKTGKMVVTTSFYPLYFFTQEIAGDKANVVNITPAGAEPHDYEPTARDMAQIENSKMLVLNGGGLEAWGGDIKQNINPKNTLIVTVSRGLISKKASEEGQEVTDPHVWLSPVLAKQITDKIVSGLIQVDPANQEYYETNANVLRAKLSELDNQYRQGLAVCREKNIVTSHAAFGYLASTYRLKQLSIAGLSPDAEPSPSQLAKIVKFAKANQVKYIFFESLVSPKLADTIANEVGAKTLVLNPIEGLSDAELSQGKNYITEMQNNLANLRIALQCEN